MPRFALARRAFMAVAACSAVVLPVVLSPSVARAAEPGETTPNASTCNGLHHGDKPGSLAITTSPASGTVLRPGDEVEVTATWDTADWNRPVLHKVLNCLLVNGSIDYARSFQEKPTDNDGLYRYRFTVPAGAAGRICDRVRLSGRFVEDGDLAVQKSNTVCFSIAAAGGGGAAGRPSDTSTAATPAPDSAAPLEPALLVPASAPPAEAPGPDPAPGDGPSLPDSAAPEISSVAYRPTLPRTGGDVLPLARLGTLLVLFGGAALTTRAALSRQAAPPTLRI